MIERPFRNGLKEGGLSRPSAALRLSEDGPNALPGGQRRTLLAILGETVHDAGDCVLGLLAVLWFEVVKWARRASAGVRSV